MNGRLPALLLAYLQHHRQVNSTDATIKHKRKELGRFVRYLEQQGHSLVASELTSLDILAHLEAMRERGLRPTSMNTSLRSIKAWCGWMVKWRIIKEDPSAPVEQSKVPRIRKPFIGPDAFQALLDQCPGSTFLGARRAAMLWLLITSGVRHLEFTQLRREDLHWESDSIRIIEGKGRKERAAPFVPQAQLAMMKYFQHRHDDLPWVWVTENKAAGQLKYDSIGQDLTRVVKRAGLKGQLPDVCHIFRRTLAANAIRQGVKNPHIRGMLDWNSDAMITHYTAYMELESEAIEEFKRIDPFGR